MAAHGVSFGPPENRKRQARDCMALLLVHGVPFARVPAFAPKLIKAVWCAQVKFGIAKAMFHGYWDPTSCLHVIPPRERVLASYYEREGIRLIALGNFTDQVREVKLSFKDLPKIASAGDAISEEPIAVQGGALSVEVGARAFRLVEVHAN